MLSKSSVQTLCVCGLVAFSLCGSGCKKEEKVAEPSNAAVQAPAQQMAATAVVKEISFEETPDVWKPRAKTLSTTIASDKVHNGKGSLKITGSTGVKTWNFAVSPTFALEAGKNYRLSCWMLVESTDDPKHPPFLKSQINDGNKFLTNANTKKYDLSNLQQWQELSVAFTAPAGQDLKGYLAVEKGTNLTDINATIYVDDVKLEIMQ